MDTLGNSKINTELVFKFEGGNALGVICDEEFLSDVGLKLSTFRNEDAKWLVGHKFSIKNIVHEITAAESAFVIDENYTNKTVFAGKEFRIGETKKIRITYNITIRAIWS